MTLQSSGVISLSQVNTELGLSATTVVSLGSSNVRTLAGVASGLIALSNLYGKSNGAVGKGYFGGGANASIFSTQINGITFATDSAFNPLAALSVARASCAGVNSSSKGYIGGGYTGLGSGYILLNVSEIDGITFATDVAFNPAATLAVARCGPGSVNSDTKGYFSGGETSNGYSYSEIDGIVFASDAAFNPAATLAVARFELGGVQTSTKGYFSGGYDITFYLLNEIDGITFATDSAFNPAATLVTSRHGLAGVNSSTKGYFGGGYSGYDANTFAAVFASEIDGITFATEAAFNPAATLTTARGSLAGVNSSINGYFSGGNTSNPYSSEIDGIAFVTDSAINPSATLSEARYGLAGVQSGSL